MSADDEPLNPEPGSAQADELWLDVDRRLRRGELDAEGAIRELIKAGLVRRATGFDFGDRTGAQHWALEARGLHGPALLMGWNTYGGPRIYAPMHRESWDDAQR